ncbi:MAG: DMSO reductase [Thiohalomonadaceae bacterium]
MQPTFSVVFLTTLIGVGQGLFLALFSLQAYGMARLLPVQDGSFFALGSFIALLFLLAGLFAAVFHLGKPSYMFTRAWRGIAQWRTSWLSRELIAIPLMMLLVFLYAVFHWFGWDADLFNWRVAGQLSLAIGIIGVLGAIALFVCTGMIYAAVKFLQEWASSLTVVNYFVLGTASGFTCATVYAAWQGVEPELIRFLGGWAIALTVFGFITRSFSLLRNARIKYKSSLQTAIGVRHTHIQQKAMGMMGGSYNTREYSHGKAITFMKSIKWIFLLLAFIVPVILLALGLRGEQTFLLLLAFITQYVGLLFERWFFFAQANHPQNLYYQIV